MHAPPYEWTLWPNPRPLCMVHGPLPPPSRVSLSLLRRRAPRCLALLQEDGVSGSAVILKQVLLRTLLYSRACRERLLYRIETQRALSNAGCDAVARVSDVGFGWGANSEHESMERCLHVR